MITVEGLKRTLIGEDVLAVARSLRAEPKAWTDDSAMMTRPYTLAHPSGLQVWVANSVYGMSIRAERGEGLRRTRIKLFGGVGLLSSIGLSLRHWVLWAAARKALKGRASAAPTAADLLKAVS